MATSIRDLHKLAYTRMPRARMHEYLHEQAVALGAQSLKDLKPYQLDELAMHVRQLPPLKRSAVSGQRSADSGGRASRPPRARSGRPGGSLRMITPAQVKLIATIAGEIPWTVEQLSKWLKRQFDAESIEALGTTANGVEAVRRLQGIKHKQRN